MNVLVINAGSSSIKYQLVQVEAEYKPILNGLIEHVCEVCAAIHHWSSGAAESGVQEIGISDHCEAFETLFSWLVSRYQIDVVAHRVVHGGADFSEPVVITDMVLQQLHKTIPLAPLHNPAGIDGITLAQKYFPGLPQVAVFDTAFHHTLPEYAYRYAVPDRFFRDYGVRRYGFHGTSHGYLAKRAADNLRRPVDALKLITLHLGNGASIAAIDHGRCVDTSMGMTPTAGLMMGTRCGDLDPGAILALLDQGVGESELEQMLNHQSGLKGVCGENDMRTIEAAAAQGDTRAQLAIDMFCYSIRKYIGAYYAVLGGLDALIFSGGIGEHSALIRKTICGALSCFHLELDENQNINAFECATQIQSSQSKVVILVVPSDEEREIAEQATELLRSSR